MGKFNGKITAEFTPPRTWVLAKALSFESDELNDGEIKKSIMLNVINNDIRIDIVTLKEDSGKLIISRILKTIGGDDLLNGD